MTARGAALDAAMARINTGEPFLTADIAALVKPLLRPGASKIFANQLTQHLRAEGMIGGRMEPGSGAAYVWRLAEAEPVLRAPTVAGPFDPNPDCEGANTGLTEEVAQWLFHTLGGRGSRFGEDGSVRDINPMEAHGWRVVSNDLLRMLWEKGLRLLGRDPTTTEWTLSWNYNLGEMAVQAQDGGFVCSLLDTDAAGLIVAAPGMATAIKDVVARFDQDGGIKKSDITALRASLPDRAVLP